MGQKAEFDRFAENYREIHTKNIQGISGADSDYFGKYKVEIVKKEWGGGREAMQHFGSWMWRWDECRAF